MRTWISVPWTTLFEEHKNAAIFTHAYFGGNAHIEILPVDNSSRPVALPLAHRRILQVDDVQGEGRNF